MKPEDIPLLAVYAVNFVCSFADVRIVEVFNVVLDCNVILAFSYTSFTAGVSTSRIFMFNGVEMDSAMCSKRHSLKTSQKKDESHFSTTFSICSLVSRFV